MAGKRLKKEGKRNPTFVIVFIVVVTILAGITTYFTLLSPNAQFRHVVDGVLRKNTPDPDPSTTITATTTPDPDPLITNAEYEEYENPYEDLTDEVYRKITPVIKANIMVGHQSKSKPEMLAFDPDDGVSVGTFMVIVCRLSNHVGRAPEVKVTNLDTIVNADGNELVTVNGAKAFIAGFSVEGTSITIMDPGNHGITRKQLAEMILPLVANEA